MPSAQSTDPRLDQARDLIREKGLSRKDIELLDEILREGGAALFPLAEPGHAAAPRPQEPPRMARLRRSFGLFLVFLNQFSDRQAAETRTAMGLVLQHSLSSLAEAAAAAHREVLARNGEPEWIIQLLDLIAALRTMATALGPESLEGSQLQGALVRLPPGGEGSISANCSRCSAPARRARPWSPGSTPR